MGEYADDYVDSHIDSWCPDRGGNAQYWPGNYPPQYTHKAKRCNRCHEAPLYWEKFEGAWRLHAYQDGKYVLHTCSGKQLP